MREQNDALSARRFMDANIFIYAFLKTERKLSEKEAKLKQASKSIIERVEKNEKIITSVVHLSEISNVIESVTPSDALGIIESILMNENIEIAEINKDTYATAIELAKIFKVGLNDCIATVIMKTNGIREIYSFDGDFDKIDGISRIEK